MCVNIQRKNPKGQPPPPPPSFPPFPFQDAVRNGKSPTRRVAQIWRHFSHETDQGFREDVPSSDSHARSKEAAVLPGGAGMGVTEAGGDSWGRDGLGRFVQGCMVFIGKSAMRFGAFGTTDP